METLPVPAPKSHTIESGCNRSLLIITARTSSFVIGAPFRKKASSGKNTAAPIGFGFGFRTAVTQSAGFSAEQNCSGAPLQVCSVS
ncbi:MAG TPA: hypothetical protein DCM18_03385 [Ruminococcus sp.]|nr:hypothetical protein [Ruminococcus sp.]